MLSLATKRSGCGGLQDRIEQGNETIVKDVVIGTVSKLDCDKEPFRKDESEKTQNDRCTPRYIKGARQKDVWQLDEWGHQRGTLLIINENREDP
ncbi:hypothetical protein YC2023_083079 [Brassica napus]